MRCNNAYIAYNKKNNLKAFLFLLLFKIEELQKKNSIVFKFKKQLTSQILNQICAKKKPINLQKSNILLLCYFNFWQDIIKKQAITLAL